MFGRDGRGLERAGWHAATVQSKTPRERASRSFANVPNRFDGIHLDVDGFGVTILEQHAHGGA